MKVFIVGAGEVGTHIASALSREGHDLVVVERDKEKVRQLQSQLDVLAVRGDGPWTFLPPFECIGCKAR